MKAWQTALIVTFQISCATLKPGYEESFSRYVLDRSKEFDGFCVPGPLFNDSYMSVYEPGETHGTYLGYASSKFNPSTVRDSYRELCTQLGGNFITGDTSNSGFCREALNENLKFAVQVITVPRLYNASYCDQRHALFIPSPGNENTFKIYAQSMGYRTKAMVARVEAAEDAAAARKEYETKIADAAAIEKQAQKKKMLVAILKSPRGTALCSIHDRESGGLEEVGETNIKILLSDGRTIWSDPNRWEFCR